MRLPDLWVPVVRIVSVRCKPDKRDLKARVVNWYIHFTWCWRSGITAVFDIMGLYNCIRVESPENESALACQVVVLLLGI